MLLAVVSYQDCQVLPLLPFHRDFHPDIFHSRPLGTLLFRENRVGRELQYDRLVPERPKIPFLPGVQLFSPRRPEIPSRLKFKFNFD